MGFSKTKENRWGVWGCTFDSGQFVDASPHVQAADDSQLLLEARVRVGAVGDFQRTVLHVGQVVVGYQRDQEQDQAENYQDF